MLPLECTHPAGTLRAGSAEIRRAPLPEYRPEQGDKCGDFRERRREIATTAAANSGRIFFATKGASAEMP